MDTYSRGDLTFDVLDEGPPGRPVVVLLHGFPQQNTSWNTALSVPHPAGFQKAVLTSRQGLASWYMFFFQLPRIPERVLLGRDGTAAGLRWLIQGKWKQTPRVRRSRHCGNNRARRAHRRPQLVPGHTVPGYAPIH